MTRYDAEQSKGKNFFLGSVYRCPLPPAQRRSLGPDEKRRRSEIDGAHKDDETRVRAATSLHDASRNGDTNQARKRHDGVGSGIVTSILLRLAHAANTHGRNGNAGAAGNAKQHRKHNDASRSMAQRQPDAQAGNNRQHNRHQARVKRADKVRVVRRQASAHHGAGIHNRNQVVRKRLVKAPVHGIRGNVRERDKERKLEQEDARRRQRKGNLAKDARVRVRSGVGGGRETRTDEEDADAAADETDEGDDAGGPAVADAVKEVGKHEREDDAAQATGAGGDAGCEAAAALEPVAYGGDAGREEEGGADAAEDAKGENELPEFYKRERVC